MLYVNVYNKKSLDRSSISTVDYYKKLINKLNLDTGDLSSEFDDLLRTIRELREHLAEDKKQVQDDLNTIRSDTHEAGINADSTLDAIQGIIDQCEEELEELETEVEAECNQCDYCDYCDYCNYTSPEPICTYDDDCNNVDCNEDCSHGGGCEYGNNQCAYIDDCNEGHTDNCTYTGTDTCFFDGDYCTYDGLSNCSFTGENCTYNSGACSYDNGSTCEWTDFGCNQGGCIHSADVPEGCTYSGYCAYTGDDCLFTGPCNFVTDGSCSYNTGPNSPCSFGAGNCTYTGEICDFDVDYCEYTKEAYDCVQSCEYMWSDDCSDCFYTCSYDDDGLSCAYNEDCNQDLVCGETSCGECGDFSDCGDGYSCGDYNQD